MEKERYTRIKEALRDVGMTQRALAIALGWADNVISRKINEKERQEDGTVDRFSLPQLFLVAEIIGVPAWQLIEGSQEAELSNNERALLKAYRQLPDGKKLAILTELINEPTSSEGAPSKAVNSK